MNATKSLIALVALAAAGLASAEVHSPENYFGELPTFRSTLSRAEVQADLNLWVRAGLPTSQGENAEAVDPQYTQHLALYQRLRSGPEFKAEVARLQGSHTTAASAY